MTQEEYIAKQLKNIDKAYALGKELLRASATLHKVADDSKESHDTKRNDLWDSLQYYNFNDSAAELAGMPETLKNFKKSLIEIKIANDHMLQDGGYLKVIDESISRVFLSHTLCKIQVIDKKVLETVQDALETLDALKEELTR